MRDEDVVGILGAAGADGNESASLQNLIKCAAVHHQVLDHREGLAAPGFHRNGGAILEVTHKQLAGSHVIVRTVGTAIDIQATCTADTFTAIVVERHGTGTLAAALYGNGIVPFANQLLVQDVQHLEERSVLFDSGDVIGLKMTLLLGVLLTPYLQIEFHILSLCNFSFSPR